VRKLIIQVPCLNEEEQLSATLRDLPRSVPGFDIVEWLVVDDGSTDATVDVARACGVDHVVRLRNHRGLAAAFQAGLDAALKLGADVVVNTDGDNQYSAADIAKLVAPIVAGRADLVVGDRNVLQITHFSATKKRLQRLGSMVVRRASNTQVPDVTSGFRAYNREAALAVVVVGRFTYTLESLIQAGRGLVAVESVPIGTNAATRDSRLQPSMWSYVRRNAFSIFRVYAAYEPLRMFAAIAGLLFLAAIGAWSPFLLDWLLNGDRSGHLQSIVLGGVLLLAAVQVLAVGILADTMAANRTVSNRILERVRRVELAVGVEPSHYFPGPGPGPDSAGPEDAGPPDPAAPLPPA
jgi:glycosyltransferase involved in cell wall biosynthesis